MITWPSRRALVFDGVVAAVLTTFCVLIARSIAEADAEPFGGWAVLTIILIGAALVFRRVAPELVLAVIVIALGAYTFADFAGGPIYLAPILPLYTIAASGDRRRLIISLVATAASFLVIALISDDRAEHLVFAFAFAGWVGGAVFLGTTQYNRRAYLAQLEQRARDLEESRDEEARRRVAEERLRIARDLHDVVAHGIATIHMQSSVALHVLERHPEQAEPALAAVKQLSRQTLDELRATLDVLRADDARRRPADADPRPRPARRPRRDHPPGRAARRRPHGRQPPTAAHRGRRGRLPHRAGVAHQRDAPRRRLGPGDGHGVPRPATPSSSRSSTTGWAPPPTGRTAGTASSGWGSGRRPSAAPSPPRRGRVAASASTPACRPTARERPGDTGRAGRRPGAAPGRVAGAAGRRGRPRGGRRGRRRRRGDRGGAPPAARRRGDGHPHARARRPRARRGRSSPTPSSPACTSWC